MQTDHSDIAPEPGPPTEKGAFGFFLLLMALFLGVGVPLQAAFPVAGLAWTQLFVFLLLPVLAAAGSNLRVAPFLRLSRLPTARQLLLAAASGVALFLVAGAVMSLTSLVLPRSVVEAFDVTRLFEGSRRHAIAMAVGASLLAPLTEEIAFRGYVLSALRTGVGPGLAISGSALLFAGMHVDPVRFPAVLLLGAYLAWLSWRSGSVWPAVLAHAVNNGLGTLVIASQGPAAAEGPQLVPALVALSLGSAVLAPLALAWLRATPAPPPPSEACVLRDPADPSTAFSPRRVPAWGRALAAIGLLVAAAMLGARSLLRGPP